MAHILSEVFNPSTGNFISISISIWTSYRQWIETMLKLRCSTTLILLNLLVTHSPLFWRYSSKTVVQLILSVSITTVIVLFYRQIISLWFEQKSTTISQRINLSSYSMLFVVIIELSVVLVMVVILSIKLNKLDSLELRCMIYALLPSLKPCEPINTTDNSDWINLTIL